MKLYARQQGQGADVISLHGLFGSGENLGMINRGLAESFRVHGLDLRNHGRSPHDEAMNYSVMAEDVLAYMDDNQLEKVHLVGHSMGGKVAMTIALMAPERVTRLAVIDIAPVTYQERRHDSILEGLSSMPLHTLNSRTEADRFLEAYEPEQGVRQFLLKNLYRDGQGLYCWRVNLPVIMAHYMEILAGQQSDTGIANKTLFIKGGESDYILPEHREQVLALFPSASMRVIPGAGHWVHAQKPELVTRTLLRFFG
ncbi:alpha/beta fold hydrolase [Endozoicomonas acroporae]|uniref:alpha/beta fold hydrolase n=1 Tax=Endozoicomonas acroporae TaxID=1701104 RepID=UPI000C777043|nr:alpha/beta fold hydrolase [Endozoicomonas acroporae]